MPADYSAIGTDIHSHLIPGIDDGVQQLEESIHLIRELSALGYHTIVTSPHIMTDGYNNSADEILSGRDRVREALVKENISVRFEAIAEYYLDETIFPKIDKRELLTVGDNFVLVELSFFNKSHNTNCYFFELRSAGYKVILAHPERYPYYHEPSFESYDELLDAGVFFQLNLSSLTGVYGKNVKAISEKLIDKGMIHFAGTDLHNLRHLSYIKEVLNEPYTAKLLQLSLMNHLL